jgi:hypothetical protein
MVMTVHFEPIEPALARIVRRALDAAEQAAKARGEALLADFEYP